jgi:phosphoglycolate phosphatase-like HAD superfamily hydrolase
VYVGDNIDDVKAAIAASAIPVGVVSEGAPAGQQRGLLKAHGAQVVLDDVDEIVEVVE